MADDSSPKPASLPVIGALLFVLLWGFVLASYLAVFLPVPPTL